MHRSRTLFAMLVLVGALVPASAFAAPAKALHQAGRWLVDGQGRVVILHGVNQVNKRAPYLPSAIGFGADDAAKIAAEGFNTVRTGLAHKGLVPAPGVYDSAYLDDLAVTVDQLTAEGIYVLLDFHQDLYGERYQGNGMAEWATVDSSPTDPTLVPGCNLGFPGNIFACTFLWEAFDRFLGMNGHAPEVGPRSLTLQEEFADAWRQVATKFRDNPRVFGYDILNEPYPGSSTGACLSPLGCPAANDVALTTFSNLVTDAVREVDAQTIVFYEPFGTNFNAGFPTNVGAVGGDDIGFSFHLYACPATPGSTSATPACRLRIDQVFANAHARSESKQDTSLLTEFGATDDLPLLEMIADSADSFTMGWQYWAWWNRDPCCEVPDEGIIDDPVNPPTSAHLDEPKLDVLVRPYPRAIAGQPNPWTWDRATRRFTFSYGTAPVDGPLAPGAVTEVWVPQRQFPTGYDVVDMHGGQVTSANDAEALTVAALPGANVVSFAVVPPACGPTPAVGCKQQVAANRGSFAVTRGPSTDAKDRLAWSWVNGAATSVADFGDPTASTTYRLCAYDETAGTPALVFSTGVAPGGTCNGKPCWRATKTGFRYTDRAAGAEGVRQVVLKSGGASRAKISVRGQGSQLALPTMPLAQDPKLTVQLRSSAGQCWEAAYSTPATRNTTAQFKDRAD